MLTAHIKFPFLESPWFAMAHRIVPYYYAAPSQGFSTDFVRAVSVGIHSLLFIYIVNFCFHKYESNYNAKNLVSNACKCAALGQRRATRARPIYLDPAMASKASYPTPGAHPSVRLRSELLTIFG
jgi:hypothetical protein